MTKPYKCRVEYLESTGTQYIDTGVNADSNLGFDVDFKWDTYNTANSRFLGVIKENGSSYLRHHPSDGGVSFQYFVSNNGTQLTSTGTSGFHYIKYNSVTKKFSYDNTEINASYSGAFDTGLNYWLFGRNSNTESLKNYASVKIYSARLYNNDTLVRDFIPVLDNSGRPAMYDQVSGQLFYNQGTGEFTYGRQIIPVEYLESTGTQYIDTGLKGKNNIDFDYKAVFTNLDGTAQCVGGNWSGEGSSSVSLYLGLIRTNGNFAYHYDGTQSPVVVMNTTVQDTPYSVQGHMWVGEQYMVINGTKSSVGTITSTFTSSLNMYLFGINNNGLSNPSYMKLYYCKIYDNGTLVRDFIPCIDENLIPFMFDKVHNTVYLNTGTGQFKFGPNVERVWGGKKLRRKLALALASLKKKRKYYCEVEYLESTGQQTNETDTINASWIDTGIIPDDTTKIECRVAFTTLVSGTNTEALFGSTGSSGNVRFAFGYASISPYTNFYAGLGGQNLTTSVTRDTNVHTFKIDAINKTWGIDDTSGSFTSSGSLSSTASIFLFARHLPYYGDDKANKPANAKTYYCKIWKGGSLVRDMIPVLDWNMTPCMYDKITEQLFYTQGTKQFSYGREIHYVDYLESTGTQYIDTGFKANTITTKYQTKITPANITTTQALFGSRNTVNVANTNNCDVFIYQSQFRLDWVNGDGSRGLFVPIAVDTPYEIEVTRGRGVVNGVVYTSTEHTSANQEYNFLIGNFTNGSSTPFSGGFIGKIYYGKLYSNNVLVRDYIPAIDENGVGYMLDRVSHTIFDNAGTGAFKYPARELEYLTSNGGQYIDTGIQPTDDYGYRIRNTYTAGGGEQCAIGCMDNGNRFVGVYTSGSSNAISGAWGSYVGFLPSYPWTTGTILDVKCNYKNSRQITIDDTEVKDISDTHITGTISNSIYIGARNYGSNVTKMKGDIYGVEITNGQNVVADFIPAFKDGQIGMYDKVSGVLKTNTGTGSFTIGKIVEPEYE